MFIRRHKKERDFLPYVVVVSKKYKQTGLYSIGLVTEVTKQTFRPDKITEWRSSVMVYYNHANFDIKKHLIRELVVGEKFKVLPEPELNINMHMLEFRCTWVTVSDVITSPFTDYLDDCYIKEDETTAYHIQEEVDLNDFSGDWHPYHMDIAETNYLILKNDRAINFIKAKPSMPSI